MVMEFKPGDRVILEAPRDTGDYPQYNGEIGTINQKISDWGDYIVKFDRDFRRGDYHRNYWIDPTTGWSLDQSWLRPARVPNTLREAW
jgi:hypothetical protein